MTERADKGCGEDWVDQLTGIADCIVEPISEMNSNDNTAQHNFSPVAAPTPAASLALSVSIFRPLCTAPTRSPLVSKRLERKTDSTALLGVMKMTKLYEH